MSYVISLAFSHLVHPAICLGAIFDTDIDLLKIPYDKPPEDNLRPESI